MARLALKVAMQNDRDFVEVFLLYQAVLVTTRGVFRVRCDCRKGLDRLTIERLMKKRLKRPVLCWTENTVRQTEILSDKHRL